MKSLLTPKFLLDVDLLNLTENSVSVKAGFQVLHVLWIEMFISAGTEETRLYIFKAYEPFNFNFMFLVIEKDVSHHDYLD